METPFSKSWETASPKSSKDK